MSTAHAELVQIELAALALTPHAFLHAPQLARSLVRLDSQPSLAIALQSPKPPEQAMRPQLPAEQVAPVECGGVGHTFLHAPQLPTSVVVDVSHPSLATMLQSPNPVEHAPTAHPPDLQPGIACGSAEHLLLQAPQLSGSEAVLTSQPSPDSLLQSAKPARHCPTVHIDVMQDAEECETAHSAANLRGFYAPGRPMNLPGPS